MTFYVVNLYILILKVLWFISKKNFCQSCMNILTWRPWSLNQKILSPSKTENTVSVPHPASKPRSSLEEKICAFATMRRYQFVQLQICFNVFGYCKHSRKATMFFFLLWCLFLCQTRKFQVGVVTRSLRNFQGFFVLLVILYKWYVFLKVLQSVIPLDTDRGNPGEIQTNGSMWRVFT